MPTKQDTSCQDAEVLHAPSIAQEFSGARLGDRRLEVRLVKLAEALAKSPAGSIPHASERKSDEDAAYRLLSHDSVSAGAILQPHFAQTVQRVADAGTVIVAHDTSEMTFGGTTRRKGLGRLRSDKDQGFLAHVSLAVAANGSRRPLGVLGLHTWSRTAPRTSKKNGKKLSGPDYAKLTNKESHRWMMQVQQTRELVAGAASLIHVMDREADAFPLLHALVQAGDRFVVRNSRDRVARGDDELVDKVRQLAARADDVVQLDVPLSRRPAKSTPASNKTFPPREARVARLAFAAVAVQLRRPSYVKNGPEWLPVNVVRVYELEPSAGVEPIEWVLFTTEPIETREQILAIVQHYRARWLIEEFFKAIKTGCAFEDTQLESYDGLVNALAVYIPIAWQMLLLRNLARSEPDASAEVALTPNQIEVLRECGSRPLSPRPTIRQALYAVAALGGHHISRPPGWLVLGRGMERLLLLETGWSARKRRESPQNM